MRYSYQTVLFRAIDDALLNTPFDLVVPQRYRAFVSTLNLQRVVLSDDQTEVYFTLKANVGAIRPENTAASIVDTLSVFRRAVLSRVSGTINGLLGGFEGFCTYKLFNGNEVIAVMFTSPNNTMPTRLSSQSAVGYKAFEDVFDVVYYSFDSDTKIIRFNFSSSFDSSVYFIEAITPIAQTLSEINKNLRTDNLVHFVPHGVYKYSFDAVNENVALLFKVCEYSKHYIVSNSGSWNNAQHIYSRTLDRELVLTRYAFQNLMATCTECGDPIGLRSEVSLPHCERCNARYQARMERQRRYGDVEILNIDGYHSAPELNFFHDTTVDTEEHPLYLGLELEVDRGRADNDDDDDNSDEDDTTGEKNTIAFSLFAKIASKNKFYANNDGSLNNGFEIISHPLTLTEHMKVDYARALQSITEFGFDDEGNAGIHVHVSRAFFSESDSEAFIYAARMAYILERTWDSTFKFTRRNEYSITRWANVREIAKSFRTVSVKDDATLTRLYRTQYESRYSSINNQRRGTFEFRIFKGSVDPVTVLATLQFVDNVARLAKKVTIDELQQVTFKQIIDFKPYNELVTYCKNLGLYTEGGN